MARGRLKIGRRMQSCPTVCDPRILPGYFPSMYLQRQLAKDFSPGVRGRGAEIHRFHQVNLVSGDRWQVLAKVQGSRMYQVNLSRQDDEVHVLCNCPFFETESACKHIWATILAADEKSYLLGSMGSGGRLQ